jgi:hypothetical protein
MRSRRLPVIPRLAGQQVLGLRRAGQRLSALHLDLEHHPVRPGLRTSDRRAVPRRVVLRLVVLRASSLPAPDLRLSRTSQPRRLVSRRSSSAGPPAQCEVRAAEHRLPVPGWRWRIPTCPQGPAVERSRLSPRRSRRRRLDPAGLGRAPDLPAERKALRPPGPRADHARVSQPGLCPAAEPSGAGANYRVRCPLQALGQGLSRPVANRAGRRDRMVPARFGAWRPESPGQWGSSPCATGRRLVGRFPR